jgi:hypothetical protein
VLTFFPFLHLIVPLIAVWALVSIFPMWDAEGMSSCPSLQNDKCTRTFCLGGIKSIWSVRFDSWDKSGGVVFPVYV